MGRNEKAEGKETKQKLALDTSHEGDKDQNLRDFQGLIYGFDGSEEKSRIKENLAPERKLASNTIMPP